jgi:hypothetical protein
MMPKIAIDYAQKIVRHVRVSRLEIGDSVGAQGGIE